MISPILPAHDATTVALDFGVFVAEHARTFRTSQTAIIAALRPHLAPEVTTPSQPPPPSQAPAASTSTTAPVDVQAEGDDASLSADPIPEAPKPLPAANGHDQQPAEAKTSDQGALSSEPGGMQDECAIHPATPSKPRKAQKAKPGAKPPTTRAKVRELHAAHPDWGHRQLCAALPDANPQTISVELSKIRGELRVIEDAETQRRLIAEAREREKAPAPGAGEKQTLNEKVRALHQLHPNWTARLIAIELGANPNSVSVALARIRNPKSVPPTAETPEFAGRRHMVEHYGAVSKRLGKSS